MWPNFLIIGAHKAGTSSLAEYLREHPDIYVPDLKEARFFAFDSNNHRHIEKGRRVFPIQTEEEYLRLFDRVREERAVGEATPEYLNSRFAAQRIHHYVPQAKLIASLRNPVDRAYSSYLMNARDAGADVSRYCDWNPEPEELARGYYYKKLATYLELFDRSRLKIVLFDDLSKDALAVTRSLYEFLDVDADYKPDLSVHNKGGLPRNRILHGVFTNRTLSLTMRRLVPKKARGAVKRIKERNMGKAPSLGPEKRKEILGYFKEDILKTQELIQIDLTHWLEEAP